MRRTSPRGRRVRSEMQPELPLGHAEVHWNTLPIAVREDVLTRWCELLGIVAANAKESTLEGDGGNVARERP